MLQEKLKEAEPKKEVNQDQEDDDEESEEDKFKNEIYRLDDLISESEYKLEGFLEPKLKEMLDVGSYEKHTYGKEMSICQSTLLYAMKIGDQEIIDFLVSKGAEVDVEGEFHGVDGTFKHIEHVFVTKTDQEKEIEKDLDEKLKIKEDLKK